MVKLSVKTLNLIKISKLRKTTIRLLSIVLFQKLYSELKKELAKKIIAIQICLICLLTECFDLKNFHRFSLEADF